MSQHNNGRTGSGDALVKTAASAAETAAEPPGGILANRDFAKLWAGQSVSLIGTQITQFALPLVAVLTLNATVFDVGVLNAVRFVPVILLSLFTGVWLDRRRRRPVLIACALGNVIMIGLVPIASAAGVLTFGLLCVVTALAGALSMVFDIGALSYVPDLVGRPMLPEANSKLQASSAVAGIAGPGLAGLLVGLITAPITLSVDAVSYLAAAIGLIAIRKPEPPPEMPEQRTSIRASIAEGMRAVYGTRVLLNLLTESAAVNLSSSAFITIFVVYAIRYLHLSPFKLGIVLAAVAVGGLIGATFATRIRNAIGFNGSMLASTIGGAFVPAVLLIPRNAGLVAMVILVAAHFFYGISVVVNNVNAITLRQVVTPRRVLARMNATYRMLLFGIAPLGAIGGGLLGSAVGLRDALVIAVIAMFSPALWILFSPVYRLRELPRGADEEPVTHPSPDGETTPPGSA